MNLVELTHVVELLERFANRRVVDKALAKAGLDRDMLNGSKGFIPYATEAVVIEAVAREIGERYLGAKVGRYFDYMTYGAYSAYVLSAPDLATALDRGRRAMLFIHPGSEIALHRTATHILVGRNSAGFAVVGHRHLDEGTPFVISQVAHHFLGADWRPDWVELPDVSKNDMNELERLIGTVIRTDCKYPAVAIRLSDLSAQNPGPPVSESSLTLTELGALMGINPAQTTTEAVKQILAISVAGSVPDEATVSWFLAVSPRTLQRALKAEGTTFRDIRLTFVTMRARTLLTQSETPIDAISNTLGYSNPRAFRRAFKKTTGLAPSEFRQQKKGA